VEGVIGSPRFINPVLAITRADHDLVALTYSGLLKLNPEGELENDLAESLTISEDGRVYNIILRQDARFHDGVSVTAEDVAFTIGLIQQPEIKSPLRGNWSGVVVEVIGPYELNLVLENPYTPFKENLTVGILPRHIWSTLSEEELPFSQHNIEPIGSGNYRVEAVKRNASGLVSEYELEAAPDQNDKANIKNIIVRFYQNEDEVVEALNNDEITSTAALSERSLTAIDSEKYNLVSESLPRVFAVFLNQNRNPILRDQAVREALSQAVDKEALIESAISGYGVATDSPLPASFLEVQPDGLTAEDRLAEARATLEAANWVRGDDGIYRKTIDEQLTPLRFTVRSANGSLFERAAENLTATWRSLGAEVTFEFYEQSDLVQTIIRPRDYQALLFGIDIGRSLDLYPFWHSSSREDPGLNVSLYANINVDSLVSRMRLATSTAARDELIGEFTEEISNDVPAIFLFSPSFEYVISKEVTTTDIKKIQRSSERWSNVTDWYMHESGVWPIFQNN
jgi:peptide/nickel transport system substrate-binding protein